MPDMCVLILERATDFLRLADFFLDYFRKGDERGREGGTGIKRWKKVSKILAKGEFFFRRNK